MAEQSVVFNTKPVRRIVRDLIAEKKLTVDELAAAVLPPRERAKTDLLVERGYLVIRDYLKSHGVNPTPNSRVAFGDDGQRHHSGWLGGTIRNPARIERVALVEVWAVDRKFGIQLHIYNDEHRSVQPLRTIEKLAETILPVEKRNPRTESVADGLTFREFERFLTCIENLK